MSSNFPGTMVNTWQIILSKMIRLKFVIVELVLSSFLSKLAWPFPKWTSSTTHLSLEPRFIIVVIEICSISQRPLISSESPLICSERRSLIFERVSTSPTTRASTSCIIISEVIMINRISSSKSLLWFLMFNRNDVVLIIVIIKESPSLNGLLLTFNFWPGIYLKAAQWDFADRLIVWFLTRLGLSLEFLIFSLEWLNQILLELVNIKWPF